jgi:nitrite reductase/ring-hydroxylating ferredoxin subunit/Fe-S cluster biogenesis protein NfuA
MAASIPALVAEDFELLAERVDKAIAAVETLSPDAQVKARALRQAIEEFHKAGLIKIVQGLKSDQRGYELLLELTAEPAVYAIFSMHGLIRADLHTRVSRVIDMARPYIQSHGGEVELAYIEDNVAWVRMDGACNGCSQTAATLRNTVEEALREQVPEIIQVEVVPNEPAKGLDLEAANGHAPQLVQIMTGPLHGAGGHDAEENHGWVKGPATSELEDARPFRWDMGETSVLLLRFDGRLQAFRNACAHLGLPLDGGIVDVEARTLTCPWHGFRFDCQSGECLTAPQAQLETLPVRIRDGHAWVRPL